jgi:hypothetical protein
LPLRHILTAKDIFMIFLRLAPKENCAPLPIIPGSEAQPKAACACGIAECSRGLQRSVQPLCPFTAMKKFGRA